MAKLNPNLKIGDIFHNITIIGYQKGHKYGCWQCQCICGYISYRKGSFFKDEKYSCIKCHNKTIKKPIKHGMSKTSMYYTFSNMKTRCYDKGSKQYKDYGGRGIRICERWLNKENGFENFMIDMGPKPSKVHTVERKDNNGNYEPENCYWGTRKEQNNNTRRNHYVEYDGKKQTLIQWSEEYGINYDILERRINQENWSFEKAIMAPIRKLRKREQRKIEFNGKNQTITEWAKELNINPQTLFSRILESKWTIEKALTTRSRNDKNGK